MPLTPHDIEQKVFSVARLGRGYAQHEVDAFLDEVKVELDRAQQVAAAALADVRRFTQGQSQPTVQITPMTSTAPSAASVPVPVAPVPVEASITKILQRGQQLADEALAEAKVEAERLKAEAQVEVEKLKAAALAELEKLKADVQAEIAAAQSTAAGLASANSTTAKILQNALSALTTPAAPPAAS